MIFPRGTFVFAMTSILATTAFAASTNKWYPDWPDNNNNCRNDGNQPSYMVGRYEYTDAATCCQSHFGWLQDQCVADSPITQNVLYGSLGVYPEYTGPLDVSGTFQVSFFANNTLCLAATLAGLEAGCTNCGIHIHSGTSCAVAADVGGHYFSGTDPWTAAGGAVYNSDSAGAASPSFAVASGFDYAANLGHAVVVHQQNGTRISCGVLQAAPVTNILYSSLGTYPEYTGSIGVTGTVQVNFNTDNTLTFSYNLAGLESDCTNCGIHIHTGTTCTTASDVGGHYFSGSDPWTAAGGAVYNSNTNGNAAGSYTVSSGFDMYAENLGHAVVVHAQDGTRVSCGLLRVETVVALAAPMGSNNFYPDWETENCKDDANAPAYMTNNPTLYLHTNAAMCCSRHFSWHGDECTTNSPATNPNMLFSSLATYPGYTGTIAASGTVQVTFNDNGSLTFGYNLAGLETTCTNCGIHIHTGTSCATSSDPGGHYFSVAVDPWTAAGGAVYNSAVGTAASAYTLTSGFNYAQNLNHAVVVHAQNGTRIACGVLGTTSMVAASATATAFDRFFYPHWGGNGEGYCRNDGNAPAYITGNAQLWMYELLTGCCNRYFSYDMSSCIRNSQITDPNELYSTLATYPGYTGTIAASGTVTVTINSGSLTLAFALAGLENACTNCGIHIHTGTSCATSSDPGGHYFSVGVDPWTAAGGAVYTSDGSGNAASSYSLTSGFDTYQENLNHAVVVHAQNGTRIACGTLGGLSPANAVALRGTNKWYVNWSLFQCVQDCDGETGNCKGFANAWDTLYDSAASCCDRISWKERTQCTPTGAP